MGGEAAFPRGAQLELTVRAPDRFYISMKGEDPEGVMTIMVALACALGIHRQLLDELTKVVEDGRLPP